MTWMMPGLSLGANRLARDLEPGGQRTYAVDAHVMYEVGPPDYLLIALAVKSDVHP